jgi:hypothetical protein
VGSFLADWDRREHETAGLLNQTDEVIARINQILGIAPDDPVATQQKRFLGSLAGFWSRAEDTRFYLAKSATIKAHLRTGHSLPGFSYDPVSDNLTYQFDADSRTDTRGLPADVPLLVKGERGLAAEVNDALTSYRFYLERGVVTTLHELVEISILHRIKPMDGHCRWFSDGFANAIASRLTREFAKEESPDVHDAALYADLMPDVNLLYWTRLDWQIKTPLEAEARLEQARYAFATLEADRLIEKHGLAAVKRILDTACTAERNHSRQLIEAVQSVTGEDLRERFVRYQRFADRDEGIAMYSEQADKSISSRDYKTGLSAMLRLNELRESYHPEDYARIAWVLHLLGHEGHADRAILDQMNRFMAPDQSRARRVFAEAFIVHAIRCGNPVKAQSVADALLADDPDCVPALVVRVDRYMREGQADSARSVAQRVLRLDQNPDSNWHKAAARALRISQNTRRQTPKTQEPPDKIELRPGGE